MQPIEMFRGRERIRTAVRAFAELCLATRPPDHFYLWIANVRKKLLQQQDFLLKLRNIFCGLSNIYSTNPIAILTLPFPFG
jgi:hypothetical protein